jgi:lysyl-tRNA synthetase class 2
VTESGDRYGRLLSVDGQQGYVLRDGDVVSFQGPIPDDISPGDFVRISASGGMQLVSSRGKAPFPTNGSDVERFIAEGKWPFIKARSRILKGVRAFFEAHEFLEVETPLLVHSPGTEVHLDAVRAELRPSPGAPATLRFLITSPEYHMKRLLSAGSGPIFQLAKVFRDGEKGAHHRPEFTMLEWYRPFAGYDVLMDDCEALVAQLANETHLRYGPHTIDLTRPWPRMTFRDALRQFGHVEPDALSADEQLECMVSVVEPLLDRSRPIFITEFPIELASLARPKPGDCAVAERFELFLGGLEIANAFGELTNAKIQKERCGDEIQERADLDKPHQPLDEEFLAALEEGCPPASGIALGLDRLVMLLTNSTTIDQVISF